MSKVHEALKRAQEEQSLSLEAPAAGGRKQNPDVRSGGSDLSTNIPVSIGERPSADPVRHIETQTSSETCRTAAATEAESTHEGMTSASVALQAPIYRPAASAAGRDPRTGQFLRFEELLKHCAKPAWVLDPQTVVFGETHAQRRGAEQFRTLRARLYQLRETAPLKKILITSALAGEGKTFVATNLAQATGQERERRVLLIDADLRNPSLHLPLGAPLSPGLTDYLKGEAIDADILQHGQEGKLCFVAAGRPASNSSELLTNGKLEKFLEHVSPLFDWVIIDSPPCLPVADANILAGFCDGVVLVAKAQSTPAAALERARKELQKRKLVGVVLNGVEQADGSFYYDYDSRQSGATQSRGK